MRFSVYLNVYSEEVYLMYNYPTVVGKVRVDVGYSSKFFREGYSLVF